MPVSGGDKMIAKLRGASRIGIAMDRWALDGAKEIADEAKRSMAEDPKTGRIYDTLFYTVGTGPTRSVFSYGKREPHQASAPGESPAKDTGNLIARTNYRKGDKKGQAQAYSDAEYSFFLEFGTDRIEERPFMRVAASNKRKTVLDAARKAVDGVIRRG